MKRRSFLLAEALIGSVLMVLAVTCCFSLLFALRKTTIARAKMLVQVQQNAQYTCSLRRILQHVRDTPHPRSTKKYPFFLEYAGRHQSPRLIFAFHNEIDLRPQHCNDNFGMLYIDEKKGLVLVMRSREIQPSSAAPTEDAYVIWPNAQHVRWRFLVNKPPPYTEEPRGDMWVEEWKNEWHNIPYAIEATITEKTDKNDRTFTVTCIVLKAMSTITVPP